MDFLIRSRAIVAFFAFSLFCIISLSVQNSGFSFTIEGIGSAFLAPFQKAYNGIQGGVKKIWAGFTELSEVRAELEKTREKLQQYESSSEEFSEIRQENTRLRALLGMKGLVTYDSVAASVISKDPDNWFRTIAINKGSSDGLKVNMPVIAFKDGQKAVVGKLSEVRGGLSRIEPLISHSIKLGVKLQSSSHPGLLYGKVGSSDTCIVDYVPKTVAANFGDIICTSGQGGVFPEGLLVGSVMGNDILESSAYQRLYVKPFIDYAILEDVFIIKKELDEDFLKLIEAQ
ncbi:MAG: rod shape-determining protein MreC [Leptospirales bacterium]|nr:rod shape-determining protein MreC [Leptospirales bacterium]